jgi:hypothetical protein
MLFVMAKLFIAFAWVVVGVSVPTSLFLESTKNARRDWPERIIKKRVRVDVDGGVFRDGSVQYETEVRVPEGAPRSLKALSFVGMLFGQGWPLAVVAGLLVVLLVLLSLGSPRSTFPWTWLLLAMMLGLWAFAARSAWSGSRAVLEGAVHKARTYILRSIAGYGMTSLVMGLLVLSRTVNPRASPSSALFSVTPLLLMAIAYAQRLLFEQRADGLIELQNQARSTPIMAAAVSSVRADATEPDTQPADASMVLNRPHAAHEHEG